MTKTTLAILLLLSGSAVASDKVDQFASAIAHAEGFGRPHVIPSRYHNPGDLKACRRSKALNGQVHTGKGGHIVFKTDADGWAALRVYINKMLDGSSRHYNRNMTFKQVARVYAGNWRPWVKIVSKELGVTPDTRLSTFFREEDPQPPTLTFPVNDEIIHEVLSVPIEIPAELRGA